MIIPGNEPENMKRAAKVLRQNKKVLLPFLMDLRALNSFNTEEVAFLIRQKFSEVMGEGEKDALCRILAVVESLEEARAYRWAVLFANGDWECFERVLNHLRQALFVLREMPEDLVFVGMAHSQFVVGVPEFRAIVARLEQAEAVFSMSCEFYDGPTDEAEESIF